MDPSQPVVMDPKKSSIESMSREELINKCKGLLGIAKQAKKAKDEFAEENQKLKERLADCETQRDADKNALLTMKEMLEEFTKNKLELSSEISELRARNKSLLEDHVNNNNQKETLEIENESLRRQVNRLTEDNDALLADIDQMEQKLQQVDVLGKEQKQHLDLLELQVEKLKEYETSSKQLATEFENLQVSNKTLEESYNTIQTESQTLASKYQSLKEINAEQRAKFQGLRERFIEVHRKLKQLKECKRILVESHHEYADSITKWQFEIKHASTQLCSHIQSLSKENDELKIEIQSKNGDVGIVLPQLPILIDYCEKALMEYRRQNEIIEELKQENQKLKTEVELKIQSAAVDQVDHTAIMVTSKEQETEIEFLKSKIAEMSKETSQSEHNKAGLEEETISTIFKAHMEIQSLKEEISGLHKEAAIAEENVQKLNSTVDRLNEEISDVSKNRTAVAAHLPLLIDCCERAMIEHRQLLDSIKERETEENSEKLVVKWEQELNTLKVANEKLKEDLSKAKRNDNEAKDVLKIKNDLKASTQICEDLQEKLMKQERENADLLNEMRELNEALKGRGDVISKQQAKYQELALDMKKTSSALTKIEADLESKEAAIKEKEMKISKMSEDNKSALQEVNKLQNASRDNESRIKSLSEELSAMRSQLENHDTQSEALSTSTISRAEELSRLREVDESFEEKYNKLRSLALKLKKKSHEQALSIAELEKQAADSKTKATEANERILSLENERESLQKELKACKNQIESLKTEVDKLKVSKKQSNVLNLEIEAFEKSLNETSAKLTTKTAEYDRMLETLHSKEAAIEVMKKENKILEESKESEKVHAVELKKQIDRLLDQLKDAVHNKQELKIKLDECLNEKQSLQSDVEELNLRVESLAKERITERAILIKEKENLVQRINSLEDELTSSNSRITLAERSFQDLHQEFNNYKVKAQSVLRQNQSKESSKERELEEELRLVKQEHKDLSDRLQAVLEKQQTNEKAIEELNEDNRCLSNRNSELQNIITDLRHNAETIARDNKKQLETYQETLKGHRLQIEALDSCHMQQMQDLHNKYSREIAELKAVKPVENVSQKPLDKIDYILMEREDAEGSEAEATHTPKFLASRKRSNHDLVPLDELLSSPIVDSTYPVLESRQSMSPSIELQETKELLLKQESRVRHLTSLLAESEQDLARLTQLNEMLKEEVRRQERTVEREKHMHNSEYLKNVVLKFVSLNNGDERTRLVPVLNTILKLSPTETDMLQNIAKGKGLDNNNRSWGSFLPNWNTS